MVPTETKLVVDTNPYVSKGFHVPQNALDRADKARKANWDKPATADEVFRYLQENHGIHTYEDLILHLKPKTKKKDDVKVTIPLDNRVFPMCSVFLSGPGPFF